MQNFLIRLLLWLSFGTVTGTVPEIFVDLCHKLKAKQWYLGPIKQVTPECEIPDLQLCCTDCVHTSSQAVKLNKHPGLAQNHENMFKVFEAPMLNISRPMRQPCLLSPSC